MANESSRAGVPGGAGSERPLQGAGIGELLGQLLRQTSELLKTELELARAEMRTSIRSVVSTMVMMLTAAVFGMVAVGCLAASLVLALAKRLEPWSAALIVGVVLLVVALGIVMVARSKHKEKPLAKTQKTLKEDVQWAKERAA